MKYAHPSSPVLAADHAREAAAGSRHRARTWRMLHLTGGYYLWFQFTVSFGKRVPSMPLYAVFLVPLPAVIALRLIGMASARSVRTVGAG
jgi:hypothetical protein